MKKNAFSLVEILAAIAILGLISSSVWVVIDRCVSSTADSAMKMQAFEVIRENMETLLSNSSVKETVEYGTSDKYPNIQWQTVVETFYEPINAQMWLRGICSAEYYDTAGNLQTIELTHWLTGLTQAQLLAILKQQEDEQELLADYLIETIEEAAQYAGVSVDTIEQWLENGMLITEDGYFVKNNLDLFKNNDGNPSTEDINMQIQSEADLAILQSGQSQEDWQNEVDPKTGLTYGELEEMDISEVWDVLKNQQQ